MDLTPPETGQLVAVPAAPSGQRIGYGRVSTRDQHLDRQIAALGAAGCARIFTDKRSGRDAARPELAACFDYVRGGDLVVVTELSRLGRSLQDLLRLVADLRSRDVGFRSLTEAIDTSTAGGRLVFHIFASLAEFIRELIVEGTYEGLAAARARGQRLGRPRALGAEQIRQARLLLARPDESVTSIAELLGVSRNTIYRHVPELRPDGGGRDALITNVRDEALAAYDAAQLPGQSTIALPGSGTTAEHSDPSGPDVERPAHADTAARVRDETPAPATDDDARLRAVLARLPPDHRPLPSVAAYDELLPSRRTPPNTERTQRTEDTEDTEELAADTHSTDPDSGTDPTVQRT